MQDRYLWDDLLSSVENRDLFKLSSLLAKRPSSLILNSVDRYGDTLLHIAVRYSNCDMVRLLVQADVRLDTVDCMGQTPLYLAIHKDILDRNRPKIAKLLASAGAHVEPFVEAAHVNELRLWTAVLRGDLDELRRRIDAGDSVDQAPQGGKAKGWTALWLAVALDREDAARLLAEANSNAADKKGRTILYMALELNRFDLAKQLVEAKVNVNAADDYGRVPLHIASNKNKCDMARLLIEAGANVNATDKEHSTPLHGAAINGCLEVAKLLVEAGANIDATDKDGKTPLHVVSPNGHLEFVKLLVNAGANTNVTDKKGETPLYEASLCGRLEIVKLLIKAGANVDIADRDGRTALYISVIRDNFEMVNLLISAGASGVIQLVYKSENPPLVHLLNTWKDHVTPTSISKTFTLLTDAGATVDGATAKISPLVPSDVIRAIVPEDTHFWLAANNDAPMLAAELAGGLDPNTKTENGMTLLHWACAGDAPECVQLLLEAGARVGTADYAPIFYCMHESSECLQCILPVGVNSSHRGCLSIHYALAANSPACVTALVGAGAWLTKREIRNFADVPLLAILKMRPVPVDALWTLLALAGARVLRDSSALRAHATCSVMSGIRLLKESIPDLNERIDQPGASYMKQLINLFADG